MKKFIKSTFATIAIAAAFFCVPGVKAQTFTFHVSIDTSSLIDAPDSPFFLDFQLNQGSPTQTNTVTVGNFVFTDGSATGSSSVFLGNPTGDMGSAISLTANSTNPFNDIFQGFTAGTTRIQFDVTTTQHFAGVPDGFVVSVLDSEEGNFQIPTNAPDTVSLMILPINAANTLSDVETYESQAPQPGVTATVTAIPEPSSVAYALGGLAMLVVAQRARRRLVA